MYPSAIHKRHVVCKCEVCGRAFIGRRKNAAVCSKTVCRAARVRKQKAEYKVRLKELSRLKIRRGAL